MSLKEQIEEAFASVLEKFGFRAGQAPPAQGTPDADRLAALEKEKAELLERVAQAEADALAAKSASEAEALAAQLERDERAIEDLKAAFQITPAVGDDLAKLAAEKPEVFSAVLPIFQKLEPMPQIAGNGGVDGAQARLQAGDGVAADEEKLHNLALAYQKEHKGSYGQALAAVSREHPELAASVAAPRSAAITEE